FFFQAEDGIRDKLVTGVQTCALPIWPPAAGRRAYQLRSRACNAIRRQGRRARAAGRLRNNGRVCSTRHRGPATRRDRWTDQDREIGRASCRERVKEQDVAV